MCECRHLSLNHLNSNAPDHLGKAVDGLEYEHEAEREQKDAIHEAADLGEGQKKNARSIILMNDV